MPILVVVKIGEFITPPNYLSFTGYRSKLITAHRL